ncbi:hypothetical protein EDD16DRAFT_1523989 [Pisolithus croceorrhizus]|nr:hypothetical protein EDD16DRAFT_1523989 [Pisolithus croceorrhizus]
MAKGCARKGMMMIGSTPGQWVKQLEIRMWKANGWKRLQLVEVAITVLFRTELQNLRFPSAMHIEGFLISEYQGNSNGLTKGDLALFCVACPQPGINLSPKANLDDWRYARTVVMDGNFKAEHMYATLHIMEKSACNNHKVISQASASHGKLNSTGVDATACAQHGCFYLHSVVDFQKGKRGSGWVDGEIIETLWSTLNIVSISTHGMTSPHCQELLDFQMNDSNFMKMIRMISSLLWKLKENWWRQEEAALKDCVHDPSVMDIFEIQLTKVPNNGSAPTVHGIELHLLQASTASGMHHGAASWLTRGLVIEEAEITLTISQKAIGPNPSDLKVAAEWTTFIADVRIYLQMDTSLDGSEEGDRNHEVASKNILVDDNISSNGGNSNCSADDMPDTDTFVGPTSSTLPLPSNLGADRCCDIGIHQLAEMELELCIAQANDALHGLHLALADKAVIFMGVVRSATNYSIRTQAWQMVHSIDRTTMITLGAKPEILNWYQELQKSHLTTRIQVQRVGSQNCWQEKYVEQAAANTHGATCYAARQQAIYDHLAEQGELKWQQINL